MDSRNQHNDITLTHPFLKEVGIPCFGFYHYLVTAPALAPHTHEHCYEICFLRDGVQPYMLHKDKISAPYAEYAVHGGDVFLTKPDEIHSTGDFFEQRGCLYWILIDTTSPNLFGLSGERTRLLLRELDSLDRFLTQVPEEITNLLMDAYHEMLFVTDPHDLQMFKACESLTQFILKLVEYNRERNAFGEVSTRRAELIGFIEQNLMSSELNVDAVARHLHYSRQYAMKIFKKELGMTIHECILRSRIQLSCELLRTYSIQQTAMLLQFSSSQHYSQVFREFQGQSPAGYQRRIRGGTLPDDSSGEE